MGYGDGSYGEGPYGIEGVGPGCNVPLYFDDGASGVWRLGVATDGRLTTTLTPNGLPVYASKLLRDVTGSGNWQLSVLPSGLLKIQATALDAPVFLRAQDSNGVNYWIQINAGLFQTVKRPADPVTLVPLVGTFFRPDTSPYAPPFTQPGGIGTPTVPAQPTGEMMGLFAAGCGHFFGSWELISATIDCQQVAVVRCPICQFCQRIISPYSAIHSMENEFIIA